MKLTVLDQSFYDENTHLIQALDNINGTWIERKTRGYGVVIISINTLTFAIPIRSNINHKAAYFTIKPVGNSKGKGLDFSKAVLITKPSYLTKESFEISKFEHDKLKGKSTEYNITTKFEKYVERYIEAVKNNKKALLSCDKYRFSTLVNYHDALGIIEVEEANSTPEE